MTGISHNNLHHNQRDLLKGAAANLFGFIARLGARLPFLFVVALLYGKIIFGQYLFAVTIVETLTAIILFGFKRSLFHFLNDDLMQNNLAGVYNTVFTTMIFCLCFGSILIIPLYIGQDFFFHFFPKEMAKGVFIILPTALLYALTEILLTATRAARKMRYEVTAKSIVEPYVLLGGAAGLFVINKVELGLFYAYWLMNISIFIYALHSFSRVYKKNIRNSHWISLTKIKSMTLFSAPTAVYDLIGVLILRIDIYFLAALVSPSALGVYGIALQIVTIVKKIRQSFDPILEPVISQTMKQSSLGHVSKELSQVSYWIFSIQAMIFTLLIFYAGPLLGLFKASAGEAPLTLLILIAAVIIQGSFGLGELIFLYKKPSVNPMLSLVILFLHASLCYFMSLKFGIVGAAASLFISYGVTELLRLMLIKYFFDVIPFDLRIVKPIFISSLLFGYLKLIDTTLELQSLLGLVFGIAGGIIVYFICFFLIAQKEEKFILLRKLNIKK
ncbi:MAG: polysaccharide biosynthesis C-terminal domain-containing protein [Emcibacter sp.]|nr:polysaccharide biosynthesis C-terminal domain-containing protein [Emcibacter sp.]